MSVKQDGKKSALYLSVKKRKVFKIVKGGPFGHFKSFLVLKTNKKIEKGHLQIFKNFRRKVSQSRNKGSGENIIAPKKEGTLLLCNGFVYSCYRLSMSSKSSTKYFR